MTTQPINDTEANTSSTGVVVDENFTDGNFDSETVDYWTINGAGTDFRAPNDRDFSFALSNSIAAGGGSFSDNFAFSIPDATTTHPSGLQQFRIAKDDEVAIVRYTTFSDIARNSREQFHVQVALLQTDPNLAGSPNFGHDLSLETESRFVSHNANHPDRLQLTANVENTENITPEQKNAYYSNTMTAADLDGEYSNLVIWRDIPGNGVTNIEQWASNAIGDYNVNAEMVNEFDPNIDPNNALFNEVRVFLQRGGTNVDLIRDNVSIDDAQIGLIELHVGVTKKTDFNLDYRTDARDFIIWYTYYNSADVTPTMLTGDADNNNAIEMADFELWKLNRGLIHDANFNVSQSVYTYDAEAAINSNYLIPSADNPDPIFAYNSLTGELAVNTQGESLVSWIVHGQVANSVVSLGSNWWTEAVGNTQQWVDFDLVGFSSNELVTIANLSPGLDSPDLKEIEVVFAGGGGNLVAPIVINNEPNNAELIAELKFEDNSGTLAADSSPFGQDNSGSLLNGADLTSVAGNLTGVVNFDGDNDYIALSNSRDINLGIHQQRTISLWFQADDINPTTGKQVLYEEGGAIRGLNIYLDAGQLYVGGWNTPESGWSGTYLSTDNITSNKWHHVALVLDGETTVQPDSFIAYLDGQEFARGEGSQLWSHGNAIGLGNINGVTKFHDGISNTSNGFAGSLDEFKIYNRVLDNIEVDDLFTSFSNSIL
ncbi:MAG: LamG domain-containing protein [Xenococcaceae cyanobacterium MO_207.B15]|nr:LamG domain-containing protein [Xenococcaceae cyanobacterium MO_207.B15]